MTARDILSLVRGFTPHCPIAMAMLADAYEEAGGGEGFDREASRLRGEAEREKGKRKEQEKAAYTPSFEERAYALYLHTGCGIDTFEDFLAECGESHRRGEIAFFDEDWLVLTCKETEIAVDEEMDRLLDEDGLVEGADSMYFDRDSWKEDARHDGAGHYLAQWDGHEFEVEVEGVLYHLFRTN